MTVLDVLGGVSLLDKKGSLNVKITGVTMDARAVEEGGLFLCLRGNHADGHDFWREAEGNGAVALVVERFVESELPQVLVENTRIAMSRIAANFYGKPSEKLKVIGVTGTNGKTTVCHMIESILKTDGKKVGIIGTLGARFCGREIAPTLTTPDPLCLHKILAEMLECGVEYVAMEVSAHAIDLHKIDDVKFEVGVFTNFSRDHLDYFSKMDRYAKTKMDFFTDRVIDFCVLNGDDALGLEIAKKTDNKSVFYGIEQPADAFAVNIEAKKEGLSYFINLFDSLYQIHIPVVGRFNVYNSLAAAACTAYFGVKTNVIAHGLYVFYGAEGRLRRVATYRGGDVYIDYAHTPDGLKNTLQSLKEVCDGRLLCVFGCGGNRDEGKRSIMGEIAGECADFLVITSDNPRYEDPMSIIHAVEGGVLNKKGKYVCIENRKTAIKYALNYLQNGDVLVIAGKGAEKYQEIMGIFYPFCDETVVHEGIREQEK